MSEILDILDYPKIYILPIRQRKELAQIISELSELNIFPSHPTF